MKHSFAAFFLLITGVTAYGQRPTAYEYHNLSASSDGTILYGSSSIEGTMSGSFPPGVIRHTYTASFLLKGPANSGIADVPCTVSQSGDPSNNYDPACYTSISLIGIGTFQQVLSDSAVCSYAGTFFSNAGTTVQAQGAYPNLNGYVTLVANANGTYTATLSRDDYALYYADLQEYFQSECGCPDYNGVLNDIQNAVFTTVVRITLASKQVADQLLSLMNKQSNEAHNTPAKGTPNSVKVWDKSKPNSPGKTVRVYGSDGRAVRDIDYGNQAHSAYDPEVMDWTWDSNGNPKRGNPRAPQPGDIPPGY